VIVVEGGARGALANTAVALGNFDGLHLGHRALIADLNREAARRGLLSVAYTFAEHPANVLRGPGTVRLLMGADQKREALERAGVGCLCVERFDAAFASMDPEAFARDVLARRLGARIVAVGYNYRFGRGNSAGADDMRAFGARHGFDVLVHAPYESGGQAVSSSRARACLEEGRVEDAALLLGRLFAVRGPVSEGKRLGRRLGSPTANMAPRAGALLPREGVYVTSAIVGGVARRAVTSVGTNPTVGGIEGGPVVETHIIGYSGDLYGSEISVCFHRRIRDMMSLPGLEALHARIMRDVAEAAD